MNMREELKAFVDNEVSEERRTQILRALENDAELQAEVIELRQISRILREETWEPQPVGLERTLTALGTGKRRTPWWLRPQVGLALGAVCVITIVVFGGPKLLGMSKASYSDSAESVASMPASTGATAASPSAKFKDRSNEAQASDMAAGSKSELKFQPQAPDMTVEERSYLADEASKSTYDAPRRGQEVFEIKTANLSVEVEDVPKAQQEAEGIAKAVGGRVQSSSKHADEGSLASAELTMRVPVQRFETSVRQVRALGRVLNDSIAGDDVTTQVVDTRARLKVMRAEEDQYIELLRETKKIGEVLSVKERLSRVRQEIESLEATRKALEAQAAESTINLSLREKPSTEKPRRDDDWLSSVWATAVSGLSAAGRGLGAAVVYLFVYAPIWLPVVFIAWLLARRARR